MSARSSCAVSSTIGCRTNTIADLSCRLRDRSLQWSWFLQGVPVDRIGYGRGPLTWLRSTVLERRQRDYVICFIEPEGWMGALTAWTINRNSRRCHAVVNGALASADIIWVYCQDPLSSALQERLEQLIRHRAPSGAVVINAPGAYNAYHHPDAFIRLQNAGVRVPRHTFTGEDRGRVQVLYKSDGRHGGCKRLEAYDGPRSGMTAFEFVDCKDADGMYRRYRAHYILGLIRPSEVFVSYEWNVCADTATAVEYTFDLTEDEAHQIRRIAEAFELQYFAVDFVRRSSDKNAVFTDVNVYPTIQSPRALVRSRGDFGGWHTFEARRRMGLPEPGGRDLWEAFDCAVETAVCQHHERRTAAMRIPSHSFLRELDQLRPTVTPFATIDKGGATV